MHRKSGNGHPKERKQVHPFQLKIDAEQGIVEEIVSVFGVVDQGMDIVHPGSFAKTIQERGTKVKVLDQHQTDSIMRILGKPLAMRELGRGDLPQQLLNEYPEATGGLAVTTQYFLDTPEGKGAFIRVKNGTVEYSFGYDPQDLDYSKITVNGKSETVRNLRTIKLYEYGPVLWGMNPATMTVSAKAVTPYHDMPMTDRETAWDGAAAEKRVREWAGGADNMDWAKYRRAFFWYDAENPEKFGSYKLGYADVVDGGLVAIPRAIFAVAAVLQGGRGGVSIPEADQTAIKRQVSRWYKKMAAEFDDEGMMAPWDKSADEKSVNLTDAIDIVCRAFADNFNFVEGTTDYYVREVFDDHLIVCKFGVNSKAEYYSVPYTIVDGVCNFAPNQQWTQGTYVFQPLPASTTGATTAMMSAANDDTQAKSGRVLSRRNAEALRAAVDRLVDVMKGAGVWDDETSDEEADSSGKDGKSTEPATGTSTEAAALQDNEQAPKEDTQAGPPTKAPTDLSAIIDIERVGLDILKLKHSEVRS